MHRLVKSMVRILALAGLLIGPLLAGAQGIRDGGLSLSLSAGAGRLVETQQVSSTSDARVDASAAGDSYQVDTGDGISVTVYGEPDLSIKDERVKGNGTISYPLIGAIQVRGLTAPELQDRITEKLADGYLKQPNVTVNIETYRMFFIKGEVKNPGGYSFQDGLTIEKAVALAGGFTERASKGSITVFRDGDAADSERKAAPTTRIRPGDVVTVGESFF